MLWGTAGYLGGALLAVLLPIERSSEPVHTAALVPRRARDYLPRRTLVAPAATAALGLAAGLAFVWLPRRPEASNLGAPWGAVVFSIVAALVTVVGARLVVRRRQPVPDPKVLASDDALRSHGLHLVFGTGIIVGALAAATITFQVGSASSVEVVRWMYPVIGLAEVFFATFAGGGMRAGWRVRPKVHW